MTTTPTSTRSEAAWPPHRSWSLTPACAVNSAAMSSAISRLSRGQDRAGDRPPVLTPHGATRCPGSPCLGRREHRRRRRRSQDSPDEVGGRVMGRLSGPSSPCSGPAGRPDPRRRTAEVSPTHVSSVDLGGDVRTGRVRGCCYRNLSQAQWLIGTRHQRPPPAGVAPGRVRPSSSQHRRLPREERGVMACRRVGMSTRGGHRFTRCAHGHCRASR